MGFWIRSQVLVSSSGLIDASRFFFETDLNSPDSTTFFFFQAMRCVAAVTIVSGAVAERMSLLTID
ncbi:hypothetical protein [Pelagicoccus sp. SDUM812002]|uniref:hypothetical protein n=1 Tax=Pelagicoccus sp. SDUM812002 TaxID=3041266 RepID=UPI0034E1FB50